MILGVYRSMSSCRSLTWRRHQTSVAITNFRRIVENPRRPALPDGLPATRGLGQFHYPARAKCFPDQPASSAPGRRPGQNLLLPCRRRQIQFTYLSPAPALTPSPGQPDPPDPPPCSSTSVAPGSGHTSISCSMSTGHSGHLASLCWQNKTPSAACCSRPPQPSSRSQG